MAALIILILFGLGTAYFAIQNPGNVHIILGNYLIEGIPLYLLVAGSILFGVFVSWLINIIDSLSSTRIIHGKDSELSKAVKTIEKLSEENHALEMENAKLKGEMGIAEEEIPDREERKINVSPSFFQRVRHSFG